MLTKDTNVRLGVLQYFLSTTLVIWWIIYFCSFSLTTLVSIYVDKFISTIFSSFGHDPVFPITERFGGVKIFITTTTEWFLFKMGFVVATFLFVGIVRKNTTACISWNRIAMINYRRFTCYNNYILFIKVNWDYHKILTLNCFIIFHFRY